MIDLPLHVFLSIAAFVALAYVVLGLTGFGSALVAVPLLLLFLPLGEVVPLVLLLDVLAFTVFGALNYAHIDWPLLWRMLPSMALGVVVAAISLRFGWLPEEWLLALLGLYMIWFGGTRLYLEQKPASALTQELPQSSTPSMWRLLPIGWIVGVIETWFGTSGPLVVAGILKQTNNMARFKATTSAVILAASLMALATYLLPSSAGTAHAHATPLTHMLLLAAWLAPIAIAAVWLGNRASKLIDQQIMRRAVYGLVIVSGCVLLLKVIRSF